MSEWIKCSEHMPLKNESCIVFRSDIRNPAPCNMYWDGRVWIPDGYGFECEMEFSCLDISHWMPLPPPPAEGE